MSGRGRIIILVGILLLLVAVAIGGYILLGGGGGAQATPTPEPLQTVWIVVAQQDIGRRQQILSGTVALYEWPKSMVTFDAIYSLDDVLNKYAGADIPAGLPILANMVADSPSTVPFGPSDLPLQIPAGKVGVALPVSRQSSVAYALQPGDHVDVLASFLVLDLDQEFQTRLVNNQMLAVPGKDMVTFMTVDPGGRDRNPLLGFPAIDQPSEFQRPRLVAQLTVQNMTVLGVGDWLSQFNPQAVQPTPVPGTDEGAAATPQAVMVPDIITVITDPQDALVLKFLREAGAQIDLVLRSSDDSAQTFVTESVTLQYIFTRFEVAEPPKLLFGIEPGTPLEVETDMGQ